MINHSLAIRLVASVCIGLFIFCTEASCQDDQVVQSISKETEKLYAALNAAKVDEVVAMFLEQGELIDEDGTIYRGHKSLKELLTAYYEKFPGTKWEHTVESIRSIGTIAIEEGTRTTTAKDAGSATMRYIAVLANTPQGWKIASIRDFADESVPTSGDLLKSLSWIIGDWINEGSDGRVKLSYRWSEDGNFILGDIAVIGKGNTTFKSSQRIGWDPLRGQPRSWMFDSDGGYAEATWMSAEGTWILNSSAVMPNGQTGSAILKLIPADQGRYTMSGSNRFVGGVPEDDFELTIVKQPPSPGK